MEPASFCFDAYHVDTQHLACEGVVHDSWNDLLPIRGDLAIVDVAARFGYLKPPHISNGLGRAVERILHRIVKSIR